MTTATTRRPTWPPRKKLMDPKRREEVGAMFNMNARDSAREIVAFEERDNGDIVITGRSGVKHILSPGRKVRRYDPAEEDHESVLEPWTLAHLDQAADLEWNYTHMDRPLAWINEFPEKAPIRAWSLWRLYARNENCTMAQALAEKDFCAEARRIVLACGWLDDESVAALDDAIKAPVSR